MRKYLIISILSISLTSCRHIDFIGKYNTCFSENVGLSKDDYMPFSNTSNIITYSDLELFELNIYKTTENKYSGDAQCLHKNWEYENFSYILKGTRFKFNLTNFHQTADTLFFLLDMELGMSHKCYITKNNKVAFIGLEKSLSGTNKYTTLNPLYAGCNDEYYNYKTFSKNMMDSMCNIFYKIQIDSLKKFGVYTQKDVGFLKRSIIKIKKGS